MILKKNNYTWEEKGQPYKDAVPCPKCKKMGSHWDAGLNMPVGCKRCGGIGWLPDKDEDYSDRPQKVDTYGTLHGSGEKGRL